MPKSKSHSIKSSKKDSGFTSPKVAKPIIHAHMVGGTHEYDSNEELNAMFKGRDPIIGGGAGYKDMIEFLELFPNPNEKYIVAKICTLVTEHPTQYLITGSTKNSRKDDGKGDLDEGLARFIPMMKQESINQMEAYDRRAMDKARSAWKDEFKLLNQTMCRRISYCFFEHVRKDLGTILVNQYFIKYQGSRPSDLSDAHPTIEKMTNTKDGKEGGGARDIKIAQIKSHKGEKDYWSSAEVQAAFVEFAM